MAESKAPNGDESTKNMNSKLDDTDFLRDLIRSENAEKARTLMEQGDGGYKPGYKKYPLIIGDSMSASIWRGMMGDTEQKHFRSQRLTDEARYPEIYPWKREAQSKKGANLMVPLANTDESQKPTHIFKKDFIDLYSAVCFANGYGVAMNVHIIIQWGHLGYTDHAEAAKQLQDGFFKPLHGWYDYNNERPEYGVKCPHQLFWIYSHECSKRAGFHTHILAGIPIEMREAFRGWVKERIAKLSKRQPVSKGIVKVVGPPSRPIERQWILFQYLCKGLDPSATVKIAGYEQPVSMSGLIQFPYSNPGNIACKNRIGMSRNLTRKEREKIDFKSFMERGVFDKRSLYTSELYDSWNREYPSVNNDLNSLFE